MGVVLLVLARRGRHAAAERRRLLGAIAIVAALACLVPAPWYAHQLGQYDSALFGQPHPAEPVWSRRPLGFFVGAGLPDVVTAPYRPSFSHRFVPIAYTEAWGDYFGVWRWLPGGGTPSGGMRRELVTMSIVGLPFTLVAVAGWLALLGLAIRHPGRSAERQLVALLPLAALAGVLYFATSYPTPDGDTVKGSFMLTAVPAWAACFGFAFDGLRRAVPEALVRLPGGSRGARARRRPVPARGGPSCDRAAPDRGVAVPRRRVRGRARVLVVAQLAGGSSIARSITGRRRSS